MLPIEKREDDFSAIPDRRDPERWWLVFNAEIERAAPAVSWNALEKRYGVTRAGLNRPRRQIGELVAFESGEKLGQLQREFGFAPTWNGLLAIAAVPCRCDVLGVVGIIMRHWDDRLNEVASKSNALRVASDWDVLDDPDIMEGGQMLARALTMIAASAVDLEDWRELISESFFEERVVLARYSKIINAAWAEWCDAMNDDRTKKREVPHRFAILPERYEAACRLLHGLRDDVPGTHLRLAQLALCEGYNFGADSKTDAVRYYYESWSFASNAELRIVEETEYNFVRPLAARREEIVPKWARCAREFTGT